LVKKGRDIIKTNCTAVARQQSIINNRQEVYQQVPDQESPKLMVKDQSMVFENRLLLD